MDNIIFKSLNLPQYFKTHRVHWDQFYPSERHVIERVNPPMTSRVLDMGCACGGLGNALREKFGIQDYTGVDISEKSIQIARDIFPWGKFFSGDFLEIQKTLPDHFDLGFSLSCADWNVKTAELLDSLFKCIKEGGTLVISCRVTDQKSRGVFFEGQQRIEYGDTDTSGIPMEYAPYKVYPIENMIRLIRHLGNVSEIYGYGYWGDIPKSVNGLSLTRVFFLVLALKKGPTQKPTSTYQIDQALLSILDSNKLT